jgi:pimeloyl-ACP methyl ester carboxylesterase
MGRHPSARHVVLPGTGHLGVITKPDLFAETVSAFVNAQAKAERRVS